MQRYSDFDINSVMGTVGSVLSNAFVNNFKTIEIRTALSPPVLLDVADLLDTKAPPSAFSQFLKPTIILTDTAGQQTTVAPYGVATNGSILPAVALVGVILGMGFLLGRVTK